MNINNINDIFSQLPVILEYFIPGFIFISVFQYFTSRNNSSYKVIGSVVISYLLKALCSIGHQYIMAQRVFTWGERVIVLTIFALLTSLFCVFISELHFVNKVFLIINHKSIHNDIWNDIIDYKNGTSLRIICNDAIYTGILVGHEEKGADSWFVIKDYIVEENGATYASESMEFKSKLAINLKNIKRVELFYGEPVMSLWEKVINWFKHS